MTAARPVCSLLLAMFAASCAQPEDPALAVPGGDAATGRSIIAAAGCTVCHVVPGVRGAEGNVGPSLAGLASRNFIAGTLPNRPEVLVRFVQDAPSLAPDIAMPAMPLDEEEARDVAAYLYTLR